MRLPALLLMPLALTACDIRTDANGDNVHIRFGDSGGDRADGDSDHVSVKVPGFSADVNLAGLDLGENTDLDGVKLAPDTSVKSMDVQNDGSKGDGDVHIAFANPSTVTTLIDYYRGQLERADFAITSTSGEEIRANKDGKDFVLAVSPQGSGSRGTIRISRH